MEWQIVSYQDEKGQSPVEDFIAHLPPKERARIYWTLALLQEFGLGLGMPYARPVRGKLWELRISARRNEYRILYFAHSERRFVLLHAFRKKSRKTPRKELDTAERRLNDVLSREER